MNSLPEMVAPALPPIPLTDQQHGADFDSLTERLKPSAKAELNQIISALENKSDQINKVVELTYSKKFIDHRQLFLDPNFEFYALAAVQEKRISSIQFGTLMFVRSGLTSQVTIDQLQVVPLFNGEAPDTTAWNYITATLQPRYRDKHPPSLNASQLSKFFELARQLPASEQSFVVIPEPNSSPFGTGTITDTLNGARFNVFGRFEIANKNFRMIPSFGMMQALLDAMGGDPFYLKPTIGESTTEDLRLATLQDARDICIHCPVFAPAPKMADDFPSPPLDFTYHDFFHLWTCKQIPKAQRLFCCELAPYFSKLYEGLVDMNFVNYRPENGGKKNLIIEMDRVTRSYLIGEDLLTRFQGLCALWVHRGGSFSSIGALVSAFEALPHQLQNQIGKAYFDLHRYVHQNYPAMIKEDEIATFTLEELPAVSNFVQKQQYSSFAFKRAGTPFKKLFEMEPHSHL